MNPYYLIPRLSGFSLLIASWGISLYLFRIEPLIPLMFGGFCLNGIAEYWKKLRLDKNPSFVREEKYAMWSIRILGVGFVGNLLTGILGTLFMTGFSLPYEVSMTFGIALAFAGHLLAAGSAIFGRRRLGG